MSFFKRKSKEKKFWDWFSQHASIYFEFEKDQMNLFTQLKNQLNFINKDLVFEFSPVFSDGSRELVISSDGIKSAFPFVEKLVAADPKIKNWKIVAFRQPRKNIAQIRYENLLISLDDVFFRYVKNNGLLELELHLKGFYPSPEWTSAVFLILDNVLGEYHTEMSIDSIEKKTLAEEQRSGLFPIRSLPSILESYKLEFNN